MAFAVSWSKCVLLAATAGLVAGLASAPAVASAAESGPLATMLQGETDQGLVGFYRTRANGPLWTEGGRVHPAARALVEILRRASLDGINDGEASAARIEARLAQAATDGPDELARTELLLSRAWVDYVRTLRRAVNVGMMYTDGARSPAAPFSAQILGAAGSAGDLAAHLKSASELNPVYSQLRAGLATWQAQGRPSAGGLDAIAVERKLRLNLDRARALPIAEEGRFILVDTASARMFLYENGRVRDSMRVVVGKPDEATPMVGGAIRNAVLNPYWNMPPDLVRKRAAKVVKDGLGAINGKNFELLSDWSANPRVLDAESVDWAAVASGKQELRIRQLPGAGNAMGAMKFNFPNDFGIFLHDTPDKSIFAQADRRLSSGCVRVEDARRLATWLFGHVPSATSKAPEQVVALPKTMPVYVTYLTAGWDGQRLAFNADGYRRDASETRFASAGPRYAGEHAKPPELTILAID